MLGNISTFCPAPQLPEQTSEDKMNRPGNLPHLTSQVCKLPGAKVPRSSGPAVRLFVVPAAPVFQGDRRGGQADGISSHAVVASQEQQGGTAPYLGTPSTRSLPFFTNNTQLLSGGRPSPDKKRHQPTALGRRPEVLRAVFGR